MQNVLVPGMLLLDRIGLKEYSDTGFTGYTDYTFTRLAAKEIHFFAYAKQGQEHKGGRWCNACTTP